MILFSKLTTLTLSPFQNFINIDSEFTVYCLILLMLFYEK